MPTHPRGAGRDAMIGAAAESLLAGREVKVLEVAEQAGVRHTLIYRHFPEGGRDELIAEAYAELFRGQVAEDLELIRRLSADPDELREQIRDQYRRILSKKRDRIRWARFEALARARSNPYVAERLDAAREELLDRAVEILTAQHGWSLNPAQTKSLAVLILGVPLGTTPMLGQNATAQERNEVADMWAEVVSTWFSR